MKTQQTQKKSNIRGLSEIEKALKKIILVKIILGNKNKNSGIFGVHGSFIISSNKKDT